MASNAYIASDSKTVMKVGKTNNFWKREKQIGLPMTAIISCPDELTAFLIEKELRHIVIEMGGIRHPTRIDWFEFDPDIHLMLQAFLESLNGFTPTSVDGIANDEITRRRKEYVRQLKKMQQAQVKEYLSEREKQLREIRELKRQIAYLEEKQERLREKLEAERAEKSPLLREIGEWKGRLHGLQSWLKNRESKPIDPEVLLNILNSLVPEEP